MRTLALLWLIIVPLVATATLYLSNPVETMGLTQGQANKAVVINVISIMAAVILWAW